MNQNGHSDGGLAQGLVRVGKEGIETGDDSVIDAYFAHDFVFHGPGGDMNLEQLKGLWAAFRTAFTGLTITREHIVADGNMLGARNTFSGVFERPYTHSPVGVVQPTGRRVSFEAPRGQRGTQHRRSLRAASDGDPAPPRAAGRPGEHSSPERPRDAAGDVARARHGVSRAVADGVTVRTVAHRAPVFGRVPRPTTTLPSGSAMNTVTSHRARGTRAPQLALSMLAATVPAAAQQDPAVAYPKTARGAVVDVYHGARVADPYRWLEGDPRRDPAVAAWVRAQDRVARSYLATLPGRDAFRRRLRALYDHTRVTAPQRHGGRYFFLRHAASANQPALVVREGADGPDRVLADPNAWSKDGTRALAEWAASDDGTRVALAVQDGGTDGRTIRVLDVTTGRYLADEIARVRFTALAWMKDGSGFFYSRFPDPPARPRTGPPARAAARPGRHGHAVYFHALGTPQARDRLVYATPAQPHLANVADVTEDGRYLVVSSTIGGGGGNALAVVDLASGAWTPRPLITALDAGWGVIGNDGTRLFLTTERGAPRGKIVTLDLADATPTVRDVVAEQPAVLNSASLLGGRLVAAYLVDAKTDVRRYRLDGTPDGGVALPGVGSAGEFHGRATDDDAFFVFSSLNAPPTVYRYDVARNATRVWSAPRVAADFARIVVEQRFYASKDGTRVPMFVVRRRDATAPAPTILYGYGGFGISVLPTYSPAQVAWVEQGGVFAVANVRGGGEYGKAWHDAGRGRNKQHTFDDVIAAAEYLKAQGIAAPDGLAVLGESNGGLMVGAVVNQRPDLFAAALPGVGVLDMLRFAHLAGGRLGYADYGDPADAGDFRALLAYSPVHNVRPGRPYPAILATTADADDRVPPAHSFKYVAALQATDLGARPRLLRVETRAGHGDGTPTAKLIEGWADQWAFAARWTGLHVTDRP